MRWRTKDLLRSRLSAQSPYQKESYVARSKSQSELPGGPQAERGPCEDLPSQCIRYTTRPSRASASVDPAVEPKSRPSKAMRLRWDDRIGGPRPVPESQER